MGTGAAAVQLSSARFKDSLGDSVPGDLPRNKGGLRVSHASKSDEPQEGDSNTSSVARPWRDSDIPAPSIVESHRSGGCADRARAHSLDTKPVTDRLAECRPGED